MELQLQKKKEKGKKIADSKSFEIIKSIFWPPAIVVLILLFIGFLNREAFMSGAQAALNFTLDYFGWLYLFFIFIFVCAVIFFAISPACNIKLGGPDAKPILSLWNWWAVALVAGIGTGIVFWGVAEPLYHFYGPPSLFGSAPETPAAAIDSMKISYIHWTFHPYSIYAVIGVAIAYSSHNLKQPLRVSSALYPLIEEKANGLVGNLINALAIFATVGCIITSMGLGTMQLGGGLEYLFGIPKSTMLYVLLIGIITACYTLSSYTGLQRGIKFLSRLNTNIFIGLVIFIFLIGPTKYFLNLFVESFGAYLKDIIPMTLWADTFKEGGGWVGSWTIFYWAWWLSLAPVLGVFLARISYGRTIRQFMFVNVLAPALFGFAWFTTFGGGAIYVDYFNNAGLMEFINQRGIELSMYGLLENFPLSAITIPLAFCTVAISFITMADSATSAISEMCTKRKIRVIGEPPSRLKLFWGIAAGSITILFLIISGTIGLQALQTSVIVAGLPIVILEMIALIAVLYGIYTKKHLSDDKGSLPNSISQEDSK